MFATSDSSISSRVRTGCTSFLKRIRPIFGANYYCAWLRPWTAPMSRHSSFHPGPGSRALPRPNNCLLLFWSRQEGCRLSYPWRLPARVSRRVWRTLPKGSCILRSERTSCHRRPRVLRSCCWSSLTTVKRIGWPRSPWKRRSCTSRKRWPSCPNASSRPL